MNKHLMQMQRSILVTVLKKNEKEKFLQAAPGLEEKNSSPKYIIRQMFIYFLLWSELQLAGTGYSSLHFEVRLRYENMGTFK